MKKRLFGIIAALVLCSSLLSLAALAADMNFTDVQPGDWFYNDVKTAVESGLVNGKSDTIYAPDDNLTYAEAVKLAACMHQLYSTGSVTLKIGNPWYQSFANYCKLNNIISKDYNWEANATRAGYMDIFSRALPDTALSPINTVPDNSIPDVPSTHEFASEIYKLYRAGILQGVDKEHNCNPGSNIKRSEVAAILTRMMNVDKRVTFIIGKKLAITDHPANAEGKARDTIKFTVKADGDELKYRWQMKDEDKFNDIKDSFVIDGSATDKLSITLPIKVESFTVYVRCVVSDKYGKSVISKEAALKVSASGILRPLKPGFDIDNEIIFNPGTIFKPGFDPGMFDPDFKYKNPIVPIDPVDPVNPIKP